MVKTATIEDVLATRMRSEWPYRVNFDQIGYHALDEMKQWCEKNCQGQYRFEHVHALYFQFKEERDAFLFKLRWSTAEGNVLK
jgi:hypothetical protein